MLKKHFAWLMNFSAAGLPETEAADGTDAGAVLSNYISIGTIKNMII